MPSPIPTATCKHCRQGFMPSRKWQLFCSDKCRLRFAVEEREKDQQRKDAMLEQLEAENKTLRAEVAALKLELERLRFP